MYIYLPRIREEFTDFVRLWNGHYIRKQKQRPHVVPGKPWVLYNLPDPENTKDYRCTAPEAVLEELIKIIEEDGINLDEYLPAETMAVCSRIVDSFGGLPGLLTKETRQTPWIKEYNMLRVSLRQYIDDGQQPALSRCASHIGSLAHLRTWLLGKGIDVDKLDVDSDTETDIDIS